MRTVTLSRDDGHRAVVNYPDDNSRPTVSYDDGDPYVLTSKAHADSIVQTLEFAGYESA